MPGSSIAVRPSPSSSSSKDPFSYSASSMGSLEKMTFGKTGANLNTTQRGNNKIYSAMAMTLKEHPLLQSSSSTKLAPSTSSPPKPKKPTPQRPTTPHGNSSGQVNFVARNKHLASSPKATPTLAKPSSGKTLSPPVSPQPSLKRVVAQSSRPISEKPLTTTTKKTTELPATVQKSAAHVRSHAAAPRTTSSSSSDATLIENLTRENRRLKELLAERSQELREAENDVQEFQEATESLQERVRQVEARNRELQSENDILRAKVVENAVKEQANTAAQSPSKLVSDIIQNQNKIRGEETKNPVPKIAPINIPAIPTTPASVTSPAVVPTPNTQTSVLSSLLLASKPKVAAVSAQREPEAPIPAVTPAQQHHFHPAMMQKLERAESAHPRTEMLDRHVEMVRDREAANKAKAMAAFNAIMEESDESEEEDYPFGREEDDIPDVQTFSDTGSTPEEDEDESIDHGFSPVPFDGSHAFSPIQEEDEEDDGDDEQDRYEANEVNTTPLPEDIEKWKSTDLNAIMEDEDEEDDEFELNSNHFNHPKQYIDQISAAAMKSTKRSAPRRLRRYSANSSNSDSGIGSAHNSPQTSNPGHPVFDLTPHSIASSQKFADSQLVSDNGYINQRLQNFADNSDEKSDDHLYGTHRASITSTSSDESDTPSHSSTATTHSSQSSNSSAYDTSPLALTSYGNDVQTSGKRYGQQHFDNIDFKFGENATTDKYSQQNGNSQNTRSNSFNNYSNNEQRSQSATSRRSSGSSENSMLPVSRLPSQTRSASRQVNDYVPRAQSPASSSRSSTPMSDYRPKVTSPYHSASSNNSSRASTPLNYPVRARAPSPPSTRSSTPASESSRTASTRQMNNGQIPPPPSPPATKDVFTTLQHYLRLLSGSCCLENPVNYYDVKQQLDEGSSAQVFSAVSRKTKQEVAIKVIPLTYSLEFIFNELYVLRNLKHQNIVEFKESFLRWDGKTREIWIVMEKCARGDVTSRAGKISQKEVARITRDLLASLKHLHANGIIHRDIKLSNILMTAKGEVKLADFGISSLTPTSTTGMVGTIPYMAPDIVTVSSDHPYSTKVDIWSLGVCVLELLTGRAAWGRIRDDEIMIRLRRGDKPYGFERLRTKSPDMPWEATDFLERCFARDEIRYSAEELLQHPFITNNCAGSRPNQCPQI